MRTPQGFPLLNMLCKMFSELGQWNIDWFRGNNPHLNLGFFFSLAFALPLLLSPHSATPRIPELSSHFILLCPETQLCRPAPPARQTGKWSPQTIGIYRFHPPSLRPSSPPPPSLTLPTSPQPLRVFFGLQQRNRCIGEDKKQESLRDAPRLCGCVEETRSTCASDQLRVVSVNEFSFHFFCLHKLQLCLSARCAFLDIHGEGNFVLNETWRITWWLKCIHFVQWCWNCESSPSHEQGSRESLVTYKHLTRMGLGECDEI